MFVIKNDDSSQDTLKELMWISGIQEFMIIASDELSEVCTKYDAIPSKCFVTVPILMQCNIQFREFVFSHERFHLWQEYVPSSIPFVELPVHWWWPFQNHWQ
jgi:hypothetical protein